MNDKPLSDKSRQTKKPQAASKPRGGTDDGTTWIKGPRHGRWRAGIRFGPEPVELDAGEFSDEQLEAIQNDPMLKAVPPPTGRPPE